MVTHIQAKGFAVTRGGGGYFKKCFLISIYRSIKKLFHYAIFQKKFTFLFYINGLCFTIHAIKFSTIFFYKSYQCIIKQQLYIYTHYYFSNLIRWVGSRRVGAPGTTGSHETKSSVIRSFLAHPRDVIRPIGSSY